MATWLEFPYECSPRELEVVRNVYFVTLTDRDFSAAYRDYMRYDSQRLITQLVH